jgi:hypothetical protein
MVNVTGPATWERRSAIGDYDAALDKTDSDTEGVTPYAWAIYRELVAARGSAYTTSKTSYLHVENIVFARQMAALLRASEKVDCQSRPGQADETVDDWAYILDVMRTSEDPTWMVRQRCETQFRLATSPTRTNVEQACSDMLGQAYVGINRVNCDDYDNPPADTYWNMNPVSWGGIDLGTGEWTSPIASIHVELAAVSNCDQETYNSLTRVHLPRMLQRMLPSWVTFSASIGDGFRLDVSMMDYEGFS